MPPNPNDPVWDVYDQLRTARLNVKYYAARLARLRRINLTIDVLLAVAAPTSAVTGFLFLNTDPGRLTWNVVTGVAAIAALVNPFLKLPDHIATTEKMLTSYRSLDHDLSSIHVHVRASRAYTSPLKSLFREALARKREIVEDYLEPNENRRLKAKCIIQVNRELPAEGFFVPEK